MPPHDQKRKESKSIGLLRRNGTEVAQQGWRRRGCVNARDVTLRKDGVRWDTDMGRHDFREGASEKKDMRGKKTQK